MLAQTSLARLLSCSPAVSAMTKAGKNTVQVEPQMHLGGRLAPAVFCPIHAVGHQLDRGRVHRMDPDLETSRQALAVASGGEVRTGVLEVCEFRPKQSLDEIRAAFLVGVGKGGAGRWSDTEPSEMIDSCLLFRDSELGEGLTEPLQ